MILATTSLSAGPSASDRKYELCTTSDSANYTALTEAIGQVGTESHGLSYRRAVSITKSQPAPTATAYTAGVVASYRRIQA